MTNHKDEVSPDALKNLLMLTRKPKSEAARRDAIIHNKMRVIEIKANPKASGDAPWYERPDLNWVPSASPLIDAAARDYGVEADLVKAIMWVETTQGYYDILLAVSDSEEAILPMNIHADLWKGLGWNRQQLNDIRRNVRVGAFLISEIRKRLESPTIEKVATLYKNLGADRVSDYGARVAKVYKEKPWNKPVQSNPNRGTWEVIDTLFPESKMLIFASKVRAIIGRLRLGQSEKTSMRDILKNTLKDNPALFARLENQIGRSQKYNDRQGYSTDFVRRLESLFDLPYSQEGESGMFSKNLVRAIELWQHAEGLPVHGRLDRRTFNSLGIHRYEPLQGPYKDQNGRRIIQKDSTQNDKYNFLKQVVKERFGVFKEGANMINIIGIRGIVDGRQVKNAPGKHNDILFLVGQDAHGNKFVKEFPASVDPGSPNPDMPTAHLRDGSYTYEIGLHRHPDSNVAGQKQTRELSKYLKKLRRSPDKTEIRKGNSLKVTSDLRYTALTEKGAVTVLRDFDRDRKLEPHEEDRGKRGIHFHMSDSLERTPWSFGCQVISGTNRAEALQDYVDFIYHIKKSANSKNITYTLVDSTKVDSMPSRQQEKLPTIRDLKGQPEQKETERKRNRQDHERIRRKFFFQ